MTAFRLTYTAVAPSVGTSVQNAALLAPADFNTEMTATANSKPRLLSLGSFVWNDADSDGEQDPAELGLAGAVALLVDNGSGTFVPAVDIFGDPIASITTAGDGLFALRRPTPRRLSNPGDRTGRLYPVAGPERHRGRHRERQQHCHHQRQRAHVGHHRSDAALVPRSSSMDGDDQDDSLVDVVVT